MLLVRGRMGQGGLEWEVGDIAPSAPPQNELQNIHPICQTIERGDSVDMI